MNEREDFEQLLQSDPVYKDRYWRDFYARFAESAPAFFNLGYCDDDGGSHCEALYAHMGRQIRPGDSVLELGCGGGGGAHLLAQRHPAASFVATDRCRAFLTRAKRSLRCDNLVYRVARAELLHFNQVFDVVLSIESSHCYARPDLFAGGVARALKPGGLFAWCDLRDSNVRVDEVNNLFTEAGLLRCWESDITDRVARAVDEASDERCQIIDQCFSSEADRQLVRKLWAVRGTPLHEALQERSVLYLEGRWRRPMASS